jgi:hypothetical protein
VETTELFGHSDKIQLVNLKIWSQGLLGRYDVQPLVSMIEKVHVADMVCI